MLPEPDAYPTILTYVRCNVGPSRRSAMPIMIISHSSSGYPAAACPAHSPLQGYPVKEWLAKVRAFPHCCFAGNA